MRKKQVLLLLLALFTILLVMAPPAKACECLGVFDQGPYFCQHYNCRGEYYSESCGGGGCIYGERCYNSGQGSCCAFLNYQTYNVYTDDCDPMYVCDNCGLFKTHDSSAEASVNARSYEATIATRTRVGFPPEAPLLVPDRCRHSYGIYSEQLRPQPRRVSRVQTSGGL